MDKQALGPLGSMGKFVVGKTVSGLGKATIKAVKPVARFAVKNPITAFSAAMMPSMVGGYMNTAQQSGLSTLPRTFYKQPQWNNLFNRKYASEGDMMKAHPEILYKIEGFEKMAADTERAMKLVKKANILKGVGQAFGLGKSVADDIASRAWKYTDDLFAAAKKPGQGNRVVALPTMETALEEFAKRKEIFQRVLKELTPPDPGLFRKAIQDITSMPAIPQMMLYSAPVMAVGIPRIRKAIENAKMNKSYNAMLSEYPELQKADPSVVRKHFDYIKTYSPTVAKNPFAAGNTIKAFISSGVGMDTPTIKNLLEVEKARGDIGKSKDQGLSAVIQKII